MRLVLVLLLLMFFSGCVAQVSVKELSIEEVGELERNVVISVSNATQSLESLASSI